MLIGKRLLIGGLALALLTDLAGELGWLSEVLKPFFRAVLLERGLDTSVDRLSVGLVGGIRGQGFAAYDSELPQFAILAADRFRVEPDYLALLVATVRPGRVTLTDGRLTFRRPPTSARAAQTVTVNDVQLAAAVDRTHIHLQQFSGTLSGIRLSLKGDLADVGGKHPPKARQIWSLAGLQNRLTPDQTRKLDKLVAFLNQQTFPEAEARIQATFEISMARPQAARVTGAFTLPDFVAFDTAIQKLKGNFTWENNRLNLHPFAVLLDANNLAYGKLQIDPVARTLAGTIQARLLPEYPLQRLRLGHLPGLRAIRSSQPICVNLKFPHVPLEVGLFCGTVRVQTGHLEMGELEIERLSLQAQCQDGVWTSPDIQAELAGGKGESVSAELTYSMADQRLRGSAKGRCLLLKRLRQAGVPIDSTCLQTAPNTELDEFEVSLLDSPLTWDQLRLEGRLDVKSLAYQEQTLQRLQTQLDLAGRVLTLSELNLQIIPDHPTPAAQGRLVLDLAKRRLVADLNGTITPALAGRLLEKGGVQTVLNRFGPSPIRYQLRLEDSPWSPNRWVGNAKATLGNGRYETLAFDRGHSSLDFAPDNLHVVASLQEDAAQTSVEAVLDIDRASGEFTMTADTVLDLRQIRVFLPAKGRARRIYDAIWNDFDWTPGAWPRTHIADFHFTPPRGGKNWQLRLNGSVQASPCTVRGVQLDSLNCQVGLDLPAKVTVTDIVATHKTGLAGGKVGFYFSQNPACHFQAQGTFAPDVALAAVIPNWDRYRDKLVFAPNSKVKVEGNLPLQERSRLRVSGTIQAPSLNCYGLTFGQSNGVWEWSKGKLMLESLDAELHGGQAMASADYETRTGNGQAILSFQGVDLNKLSRNFRPSSSERNQGKIEGQCDLTLSHSGDDRQLRLYGPGSLKLTDGNLWEMPLFRKLGDLLRLSPVRALSGLGRIANLDADLDFQGSRVSVPRLSTDGTIISLKGKGNYHWPTQGLDFRVQGILLKQTWLIPLATKFLSWIFEAELGGTVQEPDWKLISALRRTIFGNGQNDSPEQTQ